MGKIGGVLIAIALTFVAFTTLAQNDQHMMGNEDDMMGQGGMMHEDNRGVMNEGEMMHEGEAKGMMHSEGNVEGMMDDKSGAEDQSDDE